MKEVIPALGKELGIDNRMAIPRVEKIILNMGLGEAVANPKILDGAVEELSAIAGQKAVVT
jgi:large subunit ribosomal protein L5